MPVELRPPAHADKGAVVERLAAPLGVVAYIGDDAGDLPAFAALDSLGSVLVEAGDLAGAEERLALFLVQYCGGPEEYQQRRGHPKLRMRHFEFAIGEAERTAWMSLMAEAVAEILADVVREGTGQAAGDHAARERALPLRTDEARGR